MEDGSDDDDDDERQRYLHATDENHVRFRPKFALDEFDVDPSALEVVYSDDETISDAAPVPPPISTIGGRADCHAVADEFADELFLDLDEDSDEHQAEQHNYSNLVHLNVACDGCGMAPLIGRRFKMLSRDFDLCESDFAKLTPQEKTDFVTIDKGTTLTPQEMAELGTYLDETPDTLCIERLKVKQNLSQETLRLAGRRNSLDERNGAHQMLLSVLHVFCEFPRACCRVQDVTLKTCPP